MVGTGFKLEPRDGQPVLTLLAEVHHNDDKDGKPLGIDHPIDRRPIAAFGNSDGDLPMLQWTAAGPGLRFALVLLLHHTDAAREWAYFRQATIGHLDKGLDEARARGLTVVGTKQDWKAI
jgi:hypothetical protein